jgi:hypothetical protein
MYIRVKRKKTTVFMHVEPTDTVLEVKQKLQELIEQARPHSGVLPRLPTDRALTAPLASAPLAAAS